MDPLQIRVNEVGPSMAAPTWSAETDGTSNQTVLIAFRGDGEQAGADWTIAGQKEPYYRAVGAGVGMSSGFAIMVVADEYTESYVYNAGTTELFFSSIRSGSRVLPNTIKSFRGSCKPAGG